MFSLFQKQTSLVDINSVEQELINNPDAVLIDVRTKQEYAGGHLPHSINLPQGQEQAIVNIVPDKDTPIYVHCYSGARSSASASVFKRMGYTHVTNIGGIASYSGKIER